MYVHNETEAGYSKDHEKVVGGQPSAGSDGDASFGERLGRTPAGGMDGIARLCFGIAAWRFFRTYTVARTPATGALAAGLILLAEAQAIMAVSETWHLSWWIYHVAILLGFLIPVGAIGRAYKRGSRLNQIADGLFVRDALAQIERSFPEAISALIAVIERRDPYLRGHMRRVAELTARIAEELDLPPHVVRAASHAALLHDVGKLGMPEAVLHKAGALTDDEFDLLKSHADRGYQMVMQAPALQAAAPAIRWHHERLDGSGYPDRIAGEEIPIEARIVAVADVWDALTSDRVYRRALLPDAASGIMRAEAGTKLDASCVEALFRVLERMAPPKPAAQRPAVRPAEYPQPSYLAS